ncbi:MAG: Imm1 family immunity protein [Candidatus Acidiferrum sp.]|jgi:hypothetical protein
MKVEFVDMQQTDNPLNGTLMVRAPELVNLLESLRNREPFGLELVGENDMTLTICLAETYGTVQYAAKTGEPPYLLAVAPGVPPLPRRGVVSMHSLALQTDSERGVKSPEFLVGGTATPFPTRYCLPYELVRDIAVYFLECGEREPGVMWESI